jgi:hypothetical protein
MKQQEMEWRRSKVLELSSQGYSEREISEILKVNDTTVHRDLVYLRQEAQEVLQHHIHETIPHEYQKAMVSLNQVLKMCWSIVNKDIDDKTRLQALALINDCNKIKVDLSTNGVAITDAIKYVHPKMDHLNTTEKQLLQDINQKKEEEEEPNSDTADAETINRIF